MWLDPLDFFFSHLFQQVELIDVLPAPLVLTWWNKRFGERGISRRLDRFLLAQNLIDVLVKL